MDILRALLFSWWSIGLTFTILFSLGTGPMVLCYFIWRIHRNIRRIANALETANACPSTKLPAAYGEAIKDSPASFQRGVGSAFGR